MKKKTRQNHVRVFSLYFLLGSKGLIKGLAGSRGLRRWVMGVRGFKRLERVEKAEQHNHQHKRLGTSLRRLRRSRKLQDLCAI